MSVSKRAVDIVGALIGLLLLAPLMLVVALAVSAGSPGAPLFRQRRAGRDGREFRMWKFRTMVVGAEALRPLLVADSRDADWLDLDRDPRITPVGRMLRRTSIDELPQLLNVLRGDMSLVGPRPLPLEEHARIPEWASARIGVRPGLTGLWQVSGDRHVEIHENIEYDLYYIRHRSLVMDALK